MIHKQKIVKVNTYVDNGIADIIETLNNFRELQTIESCEGEQESFIVFVYGENWKDTAYFIFEFLAPKLVTTFNDNIDISMRMNSLGNIQGELLIKRNIIKKFDKYLKRIVREYEY